MHSFRHSGEACAGLDPVAGIQCSQALKNSWTPFFNGVTTFYEIINIRFQSAPHVIEPGQRPATLIVIRLNMPARSGVEIQPMPIPMRVLRLIVLAPFTNPTPTTPPTID
jgi:hypothetical protein